MTAIRKIATYISTAHRLLVVLPGPFIPQFGSLDRVHCTYNAKTVQYDIITAQVNYNGSV